MNQKYKAKGIILKGSSIKENDRLVTVLTPEYGVIRAVAPGAKKLKSRLRGRTELFVVNELLIIKGRSLDKIIQADTIYTYPGLSRDIGKLAAAQYLAELALLLAVDEQPQEDLYELLNEHLRRLESFPSYQLVYPYLAQAVFHLIAISGLAPQVFNCCVTQTAIAPHLAIQDWQVGFSFQGGGVVDLAVVRATRENNLGNKPILKDTATHNDIASRHFEDREAQYNNRLPNIDRHLSSLDLALLQQLNQKQSPDVTKLPSQQLKNFDLDVAWLKVEKLLREYIQYHIGRKIRSANLVDSLYVEF